MSNWGRDHAEGEDGRDWALDQWRKKNLKELNKKKKREKEELIDIPERQKNSALWGNSVPMKLQV